VLVLAHTDGLGVDLDELGEWVHEPAADGDRAADRDILLGELLACDLGGRVHRGPALIDHDDLWLAGEIEAADERLSLATGGAVADGDGLDLVAPAHVGELVRRFLHAAVALGWVDGVGVQELALCVEADDLAAGAEAGVDGEDALGAERGGQKQLPQVLGEDLDGFVIGALLALHSRLGLHRECQEALVAIMHGGADLLRCGAVAEDELLLEELDGVVLRRGDTEGQEALVLAAADGEDAV